MQRTWRSNGRWATLLAAFLILTAGSALAQRRSNTTGIFLNAHLNATGISYNLSDFDDEGDETDSGGGLGLQVGYGFSPLVTVYLAANGSGMKNDSDDAYTLSHVDLGVRFNFGAGRRTVPYANLAFGYRAARVEVGRRGSEIEYSGGGLTLGGGVQYFLSPALALDGGLQVTLGTFTDVRVNNVIVEDRLDVESASVRLGFGLSWFPMRPRR